MGPSVGQLQEPEATNVLAMASALRRPRGAALAALLGLAALAMLAGAAGAATLCVGTSAGCDATYASTDAALAAAAPGDTMVLRGQDLGSLVLAEDGIALDARLNRWGTDSWRTVASRVTDLGAADDVRVLPFLRATDGRQDPPSPVVRPATHCSTAGLVPLDLHDALGCAHPGGAIYLGPSADPIDPAPPGLGPYTVFKNRVIVAGPALGAEDALLTGLTLCGSTTGAACDPAAKGGVHLTSSTGDTVIVKADGIALQAMTITVRGESSPGENHAVEVPTGMAVDRLQVLDSLLRPDLLGGQAEAENGVRGRLTDAVIARNEFRGFAAGVFLRPYGADNTVRDNAFVANPTGVLTWSPGTLVDHNTFVGATMAVDVAELQGDPTTNGDGNVLRRNDFTGARLGVRNRILNSDVSVDARLNTWGTDDWRLIPPKIENTGAGNRVLFLPFYRVSDGQQDPPSVVVVPSTHCGGAPHLSIGEGLGCAHAGSRVLVQPSLNAVEPTPYLESVTVDKNSQGATLSGLTLCATVAYFECAAVDEPARWGIFSAAAWGTPPVAHTGQAIRMAGTGGSTSLFTRDALGMGAPRIGDLRGLGFDLLRESGACPAGSPRMTLRIDTTGDGVKDLDYHVYAGSGFTCLPAGQWVHVDLLGSDQWGGIPGTTRAAADAALGDHAIVSMNLIVDGGAAGDVLWVDNQRYQDSFFREAIEETCSDNGAVPCTPRELRFDATPRAIVDATGLDKTALRVVAPGLTVDGMTMRVTDAAERIVVADGTTGFTLRGSTVQSGSLGPHPLTPSAATWPNAGPAGNFIEDPFVQEVLGSAGLAELVAAHSADEGYLFATPVLTPLPHIGIAYQGAAPPSLAGHATKALLGGALPIAPFLQAHGYLVLAYEDAPLQTMKQRLPDDLVTYPLDDVALSTPVTTAPAEGIGPGSFIIMRNPDGNFRCTANFVWKNLSSPAGDNLFLGAAGHCFSQAGAANSALRSYRIEACVKNCFTDTVRCGTVTCTPEFGAHTVILYNCPHPLNTLTDELPSPFGTGKCRGLYSSGDRGAGNDFGAVQIPPSLYPFVRYSIPNFGGPTGVRSPGPALGENVVHYGHGAAFGELFPTEARAGVVLGTKSGTTPSLATHFTFLSAGAPGDSGSDVAIGTLRAGKWFVGEKAAGILTHLALVNTVQDPIKPPGATIATTVPRAIHMASLAEGMGTSFGAVGSPTSQRYNFCLMTIAEDCVDVSPIRGAGVSLTNAAGATVDGNDLVQGTVGAELNPGADGVRGAPLSGASIRDNRFADWLGAGVALTGGSGNVLDGNAFTRGNVGVLLAGSSANQLTDNAFQAVAVGVHTTGGTGNVLRSNDLRLPAVAVRVTGNNLNVDGRLNDWGDYDYRTLSRRVLLEGTNDRVRQVPFLDVDGRPEPPLVQRWNGGVATAFLGLQDAHDDPATGAGSLLQVPTGTLVPVDGIVVGGQVEKHSRTPWLEAVTLSKAGITLCGQQLDRNLPCSIAGPARPALDATGIGSTALRITGAGITVQGMTVRVATEPSKAIDATAAAGVVLRDNTAEAGPNGLPGELLGGLVPVATAPLPLAQYFEHPFVAATWGGAALAAIQAAHAGDEGLIAAVPSTFGHVALVYRGDAPTGVRDGEEQGLPVKVYGHVAGETLAEPIGEAATEGVTVLTADDFPAGAPMGPNVPRTTEGIGPGSRLHIFWGASGFRCTANFVFRNPVTNDFYIGTAGHCLFSPTQAGFANSQQAGYTPPTSFQVCIATCTGGTVSLSEAGVGNVQPTMGTFVNFGVGQVLYAQKTDAGNGFGQDFAWIKIPAAFHPLVRPYEWFWGGPTEVGEAEPGRAIVHYGHGRFLGETQFSQGRAGLLATPELLGDGSYEGLGWVTGGDSGSAALLGSLRTGQRLVGDEALGDITHSIVTVGAPLFIGTQVWHALDFLEARTGAQLDLVRESTSIVPAPPVGPVGIDISNTVGALVQGNALLGGAGQGRPGTGVLGFNADAASILDNEVRGWLGSGVVLDGDAAGNALDDNRIGEGCSGVTIGDSPDNILRRNSLAGLSCKGVLVTSAGGGSASDGNVLRLNRFRGVETPLQVENQDGITVDARANDWGVYEWQLVVRQAQNLGDNEVPVIPYLLADGKVEPALISLYGGTCGGRGPEAPEMDCLFLGIDDALAYAPPGATVVVPGSWNGHNPTPRFGQVRVDGDAVTLCAAPAGGITCAPSPDTAILDAAGEGAVLVVSGTGSTVQGFTLRAGQDGIAGVDLSGSTDAALRDNAIEVGSGAVGEDPIASASAFSGAGDGSFRDAWTQQVLGSEEFADLVARHEGDRGFVTAVPVKASRTVALLYRGDPPSGAGRGETVLGAPVVTSSATLQSLARPIPADVAQAIWDKAAAPDGPQLPGAPEGMGPGTALILFRPDGAFGCTVNWVYRNAANPSEVYLGAAGHCFLAAGVDQGANPPVTVMACVRNCAIDDLGLQAVGDWVTLGNVPYAIQQGEVQPDAVFDPLLGPSFCQVGCDFGIVRVPAALVDQVRPWMWFWRGPTGTGIADTGDVLVQYGYGAAVGETFPTQGRAFVSLGTQSGAPPTGGRHLAFYGPGAPGDSGSGIATSHTPSGEVLRGDEAVGILTHIVLFGSSDAPAGEDPLSPTGATVGTTVGRAIQLVQSAIGMTLTVVTEDEELAPPPPPPPPGAPTVGVELAGSTGALGQGNDVFVSGGVLALGWDNDDATSGAEIRDNGIFADDIGVRISGDDAIVAGNTIAGLGVFSGDPLREAFGVLVQGGAEDYLIESNDISDWEHAGIYVANPAGTGLITGNVLHGIGRSAILAQNSGPANAVRIVDNDFLGNGLRAINLEATVGAVVADNRIALDPVTAGDEAPGSGAGVWVQGATGTRLNGNAFTGTGTAAVAITDRVVDGASIAEPADLVLRRNLMRLDGNAFAITLSPDVDGLTVDARLNDWGVYNFRALPSRVQDRGAGNRVLQLPFLMPDGSSEPPSPGVFPGSHCGAEGKVPIDLAEALGCAHAGGLVVLRPSGNLTDPTPYVDGGVVEANSEGQLLRDLTLCSGPLGVNDCSQPRAAGTVLQGGLTVRVPGVTVKGVTFDAAGPGLLAEAPVDARLTHWEAYKLSAVRARIAGPEAANVAVVPFLDTDAATPILPPTARFGASAAVSDRLTPVVFTDATLKGSKALQAWRWTFGDGASAQGSAVRHTYAALGDFAVRLTVEDGAELTSSAEGTMRIVNLAPAAAFAPDREPADRADPVRFTDRSVDRDGTIVSWAWDFGDGTTSTLASPEHRYELLGSYGVTLVVTDSDGARESAALWVTVVNLAPAAAFSRDIVHPMLLQPVQFEDLTVDRDGTIVSWAWDFDDGLTSTLQDPTHAFTRGGWHHVTLTVTDDDGATVATAQDVYVCAPAGEEALVDPSHVRLEFDACFRLDNIEYPW